ncbi:MAG: hypothetical protein RL331_317 [Bacteroidota bacterium]|jgi:hypothetical protein
MPLKQLIVRTSGNSLCLQNRERYFKPLAHNKKKPQVIGAFLDY